MPHPSGAQVVLSHGEHRAIVVEVGGGLRTYRVGDDDVLDGYAEDQACSAGRGQALLPWPNRVRDGRYAFAEADLQLALTEPPAHNAIHGLTRWAAWAVAERGEDHATLTLRLHPQPGWPFLLDLALEYRLGEDGLSVRTTATNVGAGHCPFGAGAHPYLTVGTPTVDTAILQAPGARHLPTDDQSIPVGEPLPVDGTPLDFRAPRPIGDAELDTAYTDLERDADGLARVRLSDPDGGRCATLWMDEAYGHLMLFTGDTVPEPGRRRRGLGVEPMTCAPDALNNGAGLIVLAPGETTTARWGITPG